MFKKLKDSFIAKLSKKLFSSKYFWMVIAGIMGFLSTHTLDENNKIILEGEDADNIHIILKVLQDLINAVINGQ